MQAINIHGSSNCGRVSMDVGKRHVPIIFTNLYVNCPFAVCRFAHCCLWGLSIKHVLPPLSEYLPQRSNLHNHNCASYYDMQHLWILPRSMRMSSVI